MRANLNRSSQVFIHTHNSVAGTGQLKPEMHTGGAQGGATVGNTNPDTRRRSVANLHQL